MPMPPYPIHCSTPDCPNLAVYKIASEWSDGVTAELKPYALCCAPCLAGWFRVARVKQAVCRLVRGEELGPPGVYRLARGQHDRALERLPEVEADLLNP